MANDILWKIEERLWTGGIEAIRDTLAEDVVMALPAPAGLLAGPDVFAGLRQAPTWSAVAMDERTVIELGEWRSIGAADYCILAYRARAQRKGEPDYDALCTSTYVKTDARWRMMQHQQTPLAS